VGWLWIDSPDEAREAVTALKQGLADAGLVEGRNFALEYRGANDRLQEQAADLVRLNPRPTQSPVNAASGPRGADVTLNAQNIGSCLNSQVEKLTNGASAEASPAVSFISINPSFVPSKQELLARAKSSHSQPAVLMRH
jgi:hypothetical protein